MPKNPRIITRPEILRRRSRARNFRPFFESLEDRLALATVFGVTSANALVRFDTASPETIITSSPITGLVGGESIIGIDFRPANGQFYGLGDGDRLYTINPTTGVATQVGSGFATDTGVGTGFDFNPVVDRIRYVDDFEFNFRINPNDGTQVDGDPATPGVQRDTNLAYAAGDPNFGNNQDPAGAAYTNNLSGATTTTLFLIDTAQDTLVRQGGVNVPPGTPSPNGGQLFTIGPLGVNAANFPANGNLGFDIQTLADGSNVAFAAITTDAISSNLYSINLATGAASQIGATPIGGATPLLIRGLAVIPTGFQFSAPSYSVNESGPVATITVNRIGDSQGTETVQVSTTNGTAVAPGDYTDSDQVLTFGPGVITQTFTIPIVNDTDDEPNETVNLALSGALLGAPSTAVLTIFDNDGPDSSATIYAVNAANNNLLRFSSGNLDAVTSTPITGLVGGDSIIGIDFRPATGQLYGLGNGDRLYTINPTTGVATQVVGNFATDTGVGTGFDFNPVVDRIRYVDDFEFNFRINPNDGTQVDGDPATPGVQRDTNLAFAAGDPNFGNNQDPAGAAYTNNFAGAATTTLFLIDTAQGALVRQGGVNVPPGTPSPNSGQLFTIGALGVNPVNFPNNGNLGFDIQTLGGGTNVAFAAITTNGTSSNLYSIDLDTGAATQIGATPVGGSTPLLIRALAVALPGALQFSAPSYSVGESGPVATITVNRIGGSEGTVTVHVATTNGTAEAPADYTDSDQVVTFGPGVTTQTLTIPIANDNDDEPDETINLALSNPTGGAVIGAQSTAVLTIVDDDEPGPPGLPDCEITTLNVEGDPGSATIEDDADNPGENVLIVTGTSGNDVIVIEPQPRSRGQFRVIRNNRVIVTFISSDVQHIVVFALAGNDKVVVNGSMTQSALLFGDEGNDQLFAARGADGLDGGSGNDRLFGGSNNDKLCGGDGNDFVYGQAGNDFAGGDAGNDKVFGEAGHDLLLGNEGNDQLFGGTGNDRMFGQEGNDQVFGEAGNDIGVGGDGNDKVSGGSGRDLLIGGDGLDTLFGDGHDDILVAGLTIHDEDEEALVAILAEWTSTNSYATRVDNIRNGGGENEAFVLDDTTVIDDGAIDTLWGGSGLDWFLFGEGDKLKDRISSELTN